MIDVTNSANKIIISDPLGVAPSYMVRKIAIVSVGAYFSANNVNGLGESVYTYGKRTPGRTTKTIVRFTLNDRTTINFDCDEVNNQVTWQGCTLAALNTAVADIQSWL